MKNTRMTKRRRRLLGKTNKKQLRAKASKRRRMFKKINRTYWLIAFGVVGSLGFMTYSIYDKYVDTLDWEKMDPSVTMASQSLDLLYDKNPESKKSKIAFTKLSEKMMDTGGLLTEDANKSNLKELKGYLNKIDTKSSEQDYEKLYAEIALKYSLNVQYDELFKDKKNKVLKENVTPATLAQLNERTFNDLTVLFINDNEDEFVSTYLSKEKELISDVESFNNLVEVFESGVLIENKVITLKDGYTGNLNTLFTNTLNNLKFNWESTKYMSGLITMLEPVTDKMISDYSKYKAYETDIANKDQAYYAWELTKADFFATVEAIHQQAIAEKRAREEAIRLAEELKNAKVAAKEYVSGLTTISSELKDSILAGIDNAQYIDGVNSLVSQAQNADAQVKQDIIDKENQAKADEQAEKDRLEQEKLDKEQAEKDKEEEIENGTQESTGSPEPISPPASPVDINTYDSK